VIALDTNVLVRFLVEDDRRQSAAAAALFERVAATRDTLFVSHIVVCEMVWVLAGSYEIPKPVIVETVRELLRARHLTFPAPDQLARAVDAFENGKGDLADYLTREHARAAECTAIATFDRALQRESGFEPPR
jgi:predicted nucleic-acid-binding protein